MCTTGRTPGSSSRVATRRISPGWPSRYATRCDPHTEQKRRRLPGEDSNDDSRSRPLSHLKRSRLTRAVEVKAAALDFLHVRQWQCPIGPSSWSISYRTVPQRQLPFMASLNSFVDDIGASFPELPAFDRRDSRALRLGGRRFQPAASCRRAAPSPRVTRH